MKRFALCLMLVACLGMVSAPAYAFPPRCLHTNSQGVTSQNFGNCVLNAFLWVVTVGRAIRTFVCNPPPAVVAIVNIILPIAEAIPGASNIVNICKSIRDLGCTDTQSLQALLTFIDTYNSGAVQASTKLKAGPQGIDPTPIIDWSKSKK